MKTIQRIIWFLLILIIFITVLPIKSTAQVLFGYLLYKSRDCQSYTFDIDLHFYQSTSSTVLFGGGFLYFGDGSEIATFDVSNPDSVLIFRNGYALRIFKTTHTYPGPGIYTIKYREYNRVSMIKNMFNSVNTPFYVESQINIDPYNGCNNSPVLNNLLPLNNDINNFFIFSLLANDLDGDSISFQLSIPKMDVDKPVKDYWIPRSKNEGNDILLSELFLNSPTSEILWRYPNEVGLYNFSLQIHEWRYLSSLKEWINMGYVTYDFNTNILENENSGPDILNFKDTALVAGNDLIGNFIVNDMESDSIRVFMLTDIYPQNHFTATLNDHEFYPTPIEGIYKIVDTEILAREWPYKLVINAFQKDFQSIESQQSAFVWVVEEGGHPDPPSNLKTFLAFRNKIGLSWNDNSDNEAGFVIERADYFFPDFIRIAALPENTTEFIDENVIPNRDYYYRVKAIGTGGSSYSEILEVREPDIITGIDDLDSTHEIILYPNPVNDQLFIQFGNEIRWPIILEILDVTGRIRQRIEMNNELNSGQLSISTSHLHPGLYFLQMASEDFTYRKKFLKN